MERVPWYITRTSTGANPFKACGDDWCNSCKMGVDAEQEACNRGEQFVYRKRCLRCGQTIACGVYRVRMLEGNLPENDAYLWVKERGSDRT